MICSFIPGRIRLRSPRFKDAESVAEFIFFLKNQSALLETENNLNTGSLLIRYDPDKITPEEVLNALKLMESNDSYFPHTLENKSPSKFNKDTVEYLGMIGAFIVCASSAFLRSKGLHIYSGLTLAGLTAQHIFKYRKKLEAAFRAR